MIVNVDELLERLADELAERVAARLAEREPASSPWLTTEEAIEYTRIPEGTFKKWVAEGRIKRHGGKTGVFHRGELDRFLGYAPPDGAGPSPPAPLRRAS